MHAGAFAKGLDVLGWLRRPETKPPTGYLLRRVLHANSPAVAAFAWLMNRSSAYPSAAVYAARR